MEWGAITKCIVEWYQQNKRILPWREEKNPYLVWVSEIMLQQTKIEAVKEYYARFIAELPTIADLAKVEEEKLLKLWEGLGYYNRARNLKKAAMQIETEYGGAIPTTWEQLKKLPGIGEYTAGAIASICFGEKVPAVDGNVLRVMARLTGSKKNILLTDTKKQVTALLTKIMPEEAGDFNEGLMELGETVCIPNGSPYCEICPLKTFCIAKSKGETMELPVREKNLCRKKEERTVFLLTKQGKIAIQKRKETGLLSGMYEFPNVLGKLEEKEINQLLEAWKLKGKTIVRKGEKKHIFSHVEWHMFVYQIEVIEENTSFLWVDEEMLEKQYAMPTAFQKVRK